MKKIINLFTVMTLVAALSIASIAQTPGPGKGQEKGKGEGKGPLRRMEGMRKMREDILAKLNLTKQQKEKIAAIDKKFETETKTMRESKTGTPQENMKKFRELGKKHTEDVMAVLTPAQKKKYQELWKQEMDKRRPGKGDGKRPGQNPPSF